MFFIHKKIIQDNIFEVLQKGPISTLDLIKEIKKARPGTSKQGVYDALKLLNKEEAIAISKSIVSLNLNWLRKLSRFSDIAQKVYCQDNSPFDNYFVNLREKEKIKYQFTNIALLASYWTHIVTILMQTLPQGENLYCYNPHLWFAYRDIEDGLSSLDNYYETDRHLFLVVGSNTKLNKQARERIKTLNSQCHLLDKPLFEKSNYHINIFGDFIFEVWIDESSMKKIANLYKKEERLSIKTLKKIQTIANLEGKSRLALSRNKKRANKLRKKIKKYFYIPKKLVS